MAITPLMSLVLATPSVTPGPQWAEDLNTALELVDSHDHSSGKGTKIPTSGLNINADLEFNSFNLTEVRSMRLDNQVLALGGTNDVRCLYTVNGELHFNDSNGNQIRLTNAGAIDISTTGGITGDYTTSSADVSYSDVSKTFTLDRSSGTRAKIDVSDVIIREGVAAANSITLKSPVSLTSSYAWSFPAALPSSTSKFLQVTTTGALENNIDVDNSGIEIISNLIQLKNLGVTTAKINDSAVTTAKIADGSVTTAKIADVNVTTAKIANGNVTTVKLADNAVTYDKRTALNATYVRGGWSPLASGNNDTPTATINASTHGYILHLYVHVQDNTNLASSLDRIYLVGTVSGNMVEIQPSLYENEFTNYPAVDRYSISIFVPPSIGETVYLRYYKNGGSSSGVVRLSGMIVGL